MAFSAINPSVPGRCHVICFGNPLHGDDGFGPAVYDALQGLGLPENVKVFAAGVRGLDALSLFDHCERAIVVDAMPSEPADGSLAVLDNAALADGKPAMVWHGAGVEQVLSLLPVCLAKVPTIQVLVARTEQPTPFRLSLSTATGEAVSHAVDWVSAQVAGGLNG